MRWTFWMPVDLLNKMMQYDPAHWITAQDGLEHPFFFDMFRCGI
jgi:serine/threonine protein kinase